MSINLFGSAVLSTQHTGLVQPQVTSPHYKETINPGWKISPNRRLNCYNPKQPHSHAQQQPCFLTPAMPMLRMSVEQAALEFIHYMRPEQQRMRPLCKSQTSLYGSPITLPLNATFLSSTFRREAKAFSQVMLEKSVHL